jgi:hypothetical protein
VLFVVVAVSDYSDVVAWFSDEDGAEVFAKFVATEGIPCHITDIWKATHFERHGVRVQRNRIAEVRQILRLKRVANGMTPLAAQLMGRRLAREGIPYCVAGESGYLSGGSAPACCETKEIGHAVAVPEPFLWRALNILKLAPPADAELTEPSLGTLPDSEQPS